MKKLMASSRLFHPPLIASLCRALQMFAAPALMAGCGAFEFNPSQNESAAGAAGGAQAAAEQRMQQPLDLPQAGGLSPAGLRSAAGANPSAWQEERGPQGAAGLSAAGDPAGRSAKEAKASSLPPHSSHPSQVIVCRKNEDILTMVLHFYKFDEAPSCFFKIHKSNFTQAALIQNQPVGQVVSDGTLYGLLFDDCLKAAQSTLAEETQEGAVCSEIPVL